MQAIHKLIDNYNVIWSTPGKTDRSAMPLGNGEVAVSLWVEEDGDLQLYIGRSDALTELDRNVKLGKVRITLSPNFFAKGKPFRQEFKLRKGCVDITAGDEAEQAKIKVFVDSSNPAIYIAGEFTCPTEVTCKYQNWRTAIFGDADGIHETSDIIQDKSNGILFYHRNGETSVRETAELESLAQDIDNTLGVRRIY